MHLVGRSGIVIISKRLVIFEKVSHQGESKRAEDMIRYRYRTSGALPSVRLEARYATWYTYPRCGTYRGASALHAVIHSADGIQ
jgi:hypothetical protein